MVRVRNILRIPFRDDGKLFEFDSGEEYELFGDPPLGQPSSYPTLGRPNLERDGTGVLHNSSHTVQPDKNLKDMPLSQRRFRRSKIWNETEKDLFQKGLEMFGSNWRKISKFIATKTPHQVKVYYKQWAETANVIHDNASIAVDSCIYLPGNVKEYNCMQTEHALGRCVPEGGTIIPESSPLDLKFSESEVMCGNELVVSSLNDWGLGSQVSLIEEVTCDPSRELEINNEPRFSPISDKVKLLSLKKRKQRQAELNKRKRKTVEVRKRKFQSPVSKEINIIDSVKPRPQLSEGQVIHISKDSDEDNEVDIDGTEDEPIPAISLFTKNRKEPTCSNTSKLGAFSDDETEFFTKFCKVEEFDKFVVAKNFIMELWSKRKLAFITLSQVISEFHSLNISRECLSRVFDFLEEKGLINIRQGKTPSSDKCFKMPRRNRSDLERLKPKKLIFNMKEHLDGGITMSHDASGAVVDTLHITEAASHQRSLRCKRNVTLNHAKLRNCFKHDADRPAPFSASIHPLALITLDIHAHSSYSEVMGLLGGYLDPGSKTLYITTAVPTRAVSTGVECDMCPFAQKDAADLIQGKRFKVVGWYHSHPAFLPNPSERDLNTQMQLQTWFKRQNSPFIGLIISPFYPSAISVTSLIRCLILDKPHSSLERGIDTCSRVEEVPYLISWQVSETFDIDGDEAKKCVDDILSKSLSSDVINWTSDYKKGMSFAEKLVRSLQAHLPRHFKEIICLVENLLDKPL